MVPQDPLPGPDDVAPRRLTRSTTDKHLGGVAGGLGGYFGIDPVIFRVAFAAATLVSGIGLLVYVVLAATLPAADGRPAWIEARSRVTTVALAALLVVCGIVALWPHPSVFGPGTLVLVAISLLGLVFYRSFGDAVRDDPARAAARAVLALIALTAALGAATGVGLIVALGGGTAVAAVAVVAGFGLVAAGVLGGPRWLILPVVVLIMPLAVVSAADIDLRGGVGEREFRPRTVADLRPEYRLGMGQMVVDLRRVELPAGTTELNLKLGAGETIVRVPDGVCVGTDAQIGAGAADLPQRADQGFDIHVVQGPADPQLRVNADIGFGHLEIDRATEGACS